LLIQAGRIRRALSSFHHPTVLAVDAIEPKRDVVDLLWMLGELTIRVGDPLLPDGDPAGEGFAGDLQERTSLR
jgi:hypothetical protein